MKVKAMDQNFSHGIWKNQSALSRSSLTSGDKTLWSFLIRRGKYFDLLPARTLINCIIYLENIFTTQYF